LLLSVAVNVGIVIGARFSSDTTEYFRSLFPVFLLIAVVGGVAAVSDGKKTREIARKYFFRDSDPS
jgi:hypothetical protein